jgi:hypothetical protein
LSPIPPAQAPDPARGQPDEFRNLARALDELVPIGPLSVKVRAIDGLDISKMKFLVSRQESPLILKNDWAALQVQSLLDHEVIVLE